MSQVASKRDVLGRSSTELGHGGETAPVADVGRFLAPDGSLGGRVGIDLDRPHVVSVVGKRGSGKSHTLGVLAEELAATDGVSAVVLDPMGVFDGLAETGATIVEDPTLGVDAVPPADWPGMVGLDPDSPAGSLLWRAAASEPSISGMQRAIANCSADPATVRAVENYLRRVASWGCFGGDGLVAADLLGPKPTVVDCNFLPEPARIALAGALARLLYRHAVETEMCRLPWLLVDEAHACYTGVATAAFETLLTRGRQPGVSVALATQRPGALPELACSQSDLLVAHRLTATDDINALAAAQPMTLRHNLADRLPTATGDALVVDDAAETAVTVRIRDRSTPDGGRSPRARSRSRKH